MDKTFMEELIKQTLVELEKEQEWVECYEEYLLDFNKNKEKGKNKGFNKPKGLSLYTTVGKRNEKVYCLRFKGQTVGEITVNKNGKINLKSLVNEETPSHEIRECPLKYKEVKPWDSKEATEFRSFFNKLSIETKTASPEHYVENSLLKEFSKISKSNEEQPRHIQPVRLHHHFFQMPTPLSASKLSAGKHEPKYSGQNGGGIDLMARITPPTLCICEIKDENEDKESQAAAMSQAVIYATFVAKLLKEQPDWWSFFSGRNDGKSGLNRSYLEVVTIMPEGDTETFDNQELEVPGTDITLRCRTLYYNKEKFETEGKFDFSGSFLNDIKP